MTSLMDGPVAVPQPEPQKMRYTGTLASTSPQPSWVVSAPKTGLNRMAGVVRASRDSSSGRRRRRLSGRAWGPKGLRYSPRRRRYVRERMANLLFVDRVWIFSSDAGEPATTSARGEPGANLPVPVLDCPGKELSFPGEGVQT